MIKAVFNNPFSVSSWKTELISPKLILTADKINDVIPLINSAEIEAKNGNHVALLVSYEAAPAFDSAFICKREHCFPPAIAMISSDSLPLNINTNEKELDINLDWHPLISRNEYNFSIKKIKDYISSGDTYQVNFTFPLQTKFNLNPIDYFHNLCFAQRANYSCFINLENFTVISLSPELFFRRDGNKLTVKPMKGTMKRGRFNLEDEYLAAELKMSKKNRAENLMIVDMLRNDLGKISKISSVNTKSLFDIEKYNTVFQMTSTVESEINPSVSIADIFKALFPCGSVTGAPKIRTMEIINEVEKYPRGIYTGAIGLIKPGGDCVFNVPIRTIAIDKKCRLATFNVGGGIVSDSTVEDEFNECLTKSFFISENAPFFQLLESLLLDDGEIFLFDEHIKRIKSSAKYFDYIFDENKFKRTLIDISKQFPTGKFKIRVLNDIFGNIETEVAKISDLPLPRKITFAASPVNSSDKFLYHKTTNRKVYTNAKADFTEYDDVILWNEKDEITETTICNIVVQLNGEKITPTISSGLLNGVYRQKLLSEGKIKEGILRREDLYKAEKIYLINSVRKWLSAIIK